MSANDRQVGGGHYKKETVCYHCGSQLQHWDLVKIFGWDYFQGQIIKYVMRWRDKNGKQDLEKAVHFLEKYMEMEGNPGVEAGPSYVDQDRGEAAMHKRLNVPTS